MFKKIGSMPARLAVWIMVFMLAGGVVGGNHNALSRARQPVVAEITSMRDRLNTMVAKSNNYTVIANRLGVDVTETARAQSRALEEINSKREDKASAAAAYEAAMQLNTAVLSLDDQIKSEIDKLPAVGSDKANVVIERDAVYSDWKRVRINYVDAINFNDVAAQLSQVYRAVPTRLLWGGYNYPQITD
ncbi:hypothetical protein FACS1894184_18810 [Clostridia bacterium]|nr:hypothetical protein FACS1894184_18810 [Clostridia bacterium]